MADLAAAIYDRAPEPLSAAIATVVSVAPLQVDRGAGHEEADSMVATHRHIVGDRVLVQLGGGRLRIVGTAATRPLVGVVTAVAGRSATVQAAGQTYTGVPAVTAVTSGAQVALLWGDAGVVIVGPIAAAPAAGPPSEPPEPPAALPRIASAVTSASPVAVCTARGGAWRTDRAAARVKAYQGHWPGTGADNSGLFFYGPGALRAPGAITPGAATITLARDPSAGAGAAREVRLALHSASVRGSAPPALSSPRVIGTLRAGATAALPLPDEFAAALLAGHAAGVGVTHPGSAHYMVLTGGLIRIPYTTGG